MQGAQSLRRKSVKSCSYQYCEAPRINILSYCFWFLASFLVDFFSLIYFAALRIGHKIMILLKNPELLSIRFFNPHTETRFLSQSAVEGEEFSVVFICGKGSHFWLKFC